MNELFDSTKSYIDEVIAKNESTTFLAKYGLGITCNGIGYEIYPATLTGAAFNMTIEIIRDNGVNIEYRIKLPCVGELLNFNTEEKRIMRYNRYDSQIIKTENLINASLTVIVSYLTNNLC